jgi:hypothetical protein
MVPIFLVGRIMCDIDLPEYIVDGFVTVVPMLMLSISGISDIDVLAGVLVRLRLCVFISA